MQLTEFTVYNEVHKTIRVLSLLLLGHTLEGALLLIHTS